jgi:hypothetical protein
VRGPSGNRLHGGLSVGVARLAISGDLAAGVIPCWQIADCALGERLRRSQLACAHAVLADHNLNIIYYIITFGLRDFGSLASDWLPALAAAPAGAQGSKKVHARLVPYNRVSQRPIDTPLHGVMYTSQTKRLEADVSLSMLITRTDDVELE